MMARVAAVALLSMPAGISRADIGAGTPHFRWSPPGIDINGNPISTVAGAPNSLKEVLLRCDPGSSTNPVILARVATPTNEWQSPYGMFTAGQHSCVGQGVLVNGIVTHDSNVVNFNIPPQDALPKAPSGLTVDAEVMPVSPSPASYGPSAACGPMQNCVILP